jgi:hypothetical protein
MTLVVADDAAWLAAFGVLPRVEEVTGDEDVREIQLPISESEDLHLTWDVPDASVRIRYRWNARVVVNVFRKLATLLTVEIHDDRRVVVVVEYRTSEAVGRCRIQVSPEFVLEDSFHRA